MALTRADLAARLAALPEPWEEALAQLRELEATMPPASAAADEEARVTGTLVEALRREVAPAEVDRAILAGPQALLNLTARLAGERDRAATLDPEDQVADMQVEGLRILERCLDHLERIWNATRAQP